MGKFMLLTSVLCRENYEMNFIQFRPLVTECLTFVAAGP